MLYQHSLIDIHKHDRITLLPITHECVQFDLAQSPKSTHLIDAWISWLVHIATTYGAKLNLNMEPFDLIRVEYPNLLSGVRWCYDQRRWDALLDLASGAWFYAHVTSLFNEFREILEYAIEAARQIGDLEREGFFCYWLGWLAPLQEQHEEGRALRARAEAIALQIENHRLLADVYYTEANDLLGPSEPSQEDFAQAEIFLRKSLESDTKHDFFQVQSMAASRLGQVIGERGEYAKSLELLAVAEQAHVQSIGSAA